MTLSSLRAFLLGRKRPAPAVPASLFDTALAQRGVRVAAVKAGPQPGWSGRDWSVYKVWKLEQERADARLLARRYHREMRAEYEGGDVAEHERKERGLLAAQINVGGEKP